MSVYGSYFIFDLSGFLFDNFIGPSYVVTDPSSGPALDGIMTVTGFSVWDVGRRT